MKLAVIATFLAAALAMPSANDPTPVVERDEINIEARGELNERGNIVRRVEGVHLVNCPTYSLVVYCPNDGNCGTYPTGGNIVAYSYLAAWEGATYGATFTSGVTFSWNIYSNAQSYANYRNVGWGDNGYTSFVCRKDDKHTIFYNSAGGACKSIYYCLPGTWSSALLKREPQSTATPVVPPPATVSP